MAILNALPVVGLVLLVLLTPFLGYFVHCSLEKYCYLPHARRWCRKNGFEVVSCKCGMAFYKTGVKSEFSIVELDCFDSNRQKRLVRLLVWVAGVKAVLNVSEPPSIKPSEESGTK